MILPTVVEAQRKARIISRPSTANRFDLAGQTDKFDVEIDGFSASEESDFVGITVEDSRMTERHRILLLGVKQSGGDLLFNPGREYIVGIWDILIVMGHADDIRGFKGAIEIGVAC